MKKILLLIAICLSVSLSAQDITLNAGNSIIGTNASNSTQLLYWSGSSAYYGRKLTGMIGVSGHYFRIDGETKLIINDAGNVGVGTTDPDMLLTVNGGIGLYRNSANPTNYSLGFLKYEDGLIFGNKSTVDPIRFQTNSTDRLYIKNDGRIGIGTTTPDTELAVNGTIHTKEVKVDLNGWSDFVFEDNYELRTLEEVENYIAENKHLPEIPSEAEVTENGINLGEMNAKLLQKIEELTLYLIEQNKKIEELQKEVSALKNESR